MTNAGKTWRTRRLLRLTPNCIPVPMPLHWTITSMLAAAHWPTARIGFYVVIALCWVIWLLEQIYSMPEDIFENYRTMGENEGLGR